MFDGLPTLAEMQAQRRAVPKAALRTRLQTKVATARDEKKLEAAWIRAVWTRDQGRCRWCKRRCLKTLALDPARGEVHHVSGRVVKAIRWDRRNGALLCLACHERITGRVAEKSVIASRHTFVVDEIAYIDADKPFRFQRVA